MRINLPFVSVVIPCYNEEAYIGNLLNGLSIQSYPNFEIIVSDAKSADRSVDVIKQLNLSVLKIVSSAPNGPAAQRNFGAKHAVGELLLFLDADIFLDDRDFIRKIVETSISKGWKTSTAKVRAKDASLIERFGAAVDYYYLKLLSHTKHPVAPGWCILTRKDIFDLNKGFNEKIFFGEDYDYVSRVSKSGFGFVGGTSYCIDLRRFHEDSLKFLYKCVANEVYRHTHKYNLENSPYSYVYGKHK
jgi:glycosyltransferase involved in cell wall biosynthesis